MFYYKLICLKHIHLTSIYLLHKSCVSIWKHNFETLLSQYLVKLMIQIYSGLHFNHICLNWKENTFELNPTYKIDYTLKVVVNSTLFTWKKIAPCVYVIYSLYINILKFEDILTKFWEYSKFESIIWTWVGVYS